MAEIHILGIHQDPDEPYIPVWKRTFGIAGDMTKFFPLERFFTQEQLRPISFIEPFPKRFFEYGGVLYCEVNWLKDLILKYGSDETCQDLLDFTELVLTELRKLPPATLH